MNDGRNTRVLHPIDHGSSARTALAAALGASILAATAVACDAEPPETRTSGRTTTATTTMAAEPLAWYAALPVADDLEGRIAYNTADGDIWVIDADGSGRRQVTHSGDGIDYSMTWAPGGTRLAFRTTRGDAPDTSIFVINLDGTGGRQLSEPGVGALFPAWSPDGTWIAYSTDEINLVRPDGTGLHSLGTDGECSVWSPDGSRIMYCSNIANRGGLGDDWNIFVINRDGTGRRQLTRGAEGGHSGVWSPDGSQIIFQSAKGGTRDLYRMNADGRNVVRLTRSLGVEVPQAWLADGRLLLAHYQPEAKLGHWYLADESGHPVASLPWLYGAHDPVAYLPP